MATDLHWPGILLAYAVIAVGVMSPGPALIVLKIVGGLYLLWLAWKSLRSAMTAVPLAVSTPSKRSDDRRMVFSGLLIHLTNPKGVFGWLATISVGMAVDAPLWVAMLIVAGGVTISAVGHIGYAIAFSTGRAVSIYARARRGIQLCLAAVFGAAGVRLLTTSFERTTP